LSSGAFDEMRSNPKYYYNLLKLSKEVPSLYEQDIEKDLDRSNYKLLSENNYYKFMLRNVLICYSIRNSTIGYCQGFNFIALKLLEITKNEVIYYYLCIILNYNRKMLFGSFAG
jgi:hypothetical protein